MEASKILLLNSVAFWQKLLKKHMGALRMLY